jgi:nucleoside 2-deoxyribosyltransferase
MIDERSAAEPEVVDGAAWIYLISPGVDRLAGDAVRERVVEVCAKGGWPTVGWPTEDPERHRDPGHLFEDVRHAVEHADCVIALLGDLDATADAELALAYSHRRPIIGLRPARKDSTASEVQAMLEGYERARVIACAGSEECGSRLHAVLSDPEFGATIRQAVGERAAAP